MTETAPVLEQLDRGTKEEAEKIQKNFAIAPDGSMVKINDYLANPETPRDEIK